jgi:hypothetical protein
MEFSMRNQICCTALGVALLAGTSVAHAQTAPPRQIADQPIDAVITQEPGAMVIAQAPLVAPPPAIVETVPVRTVETVRTVQSSAPPKQRIVNSRVVRSRNGDRVTTTRTTVREAVVQRPAISVMRYPAPLYNYAPGAVAAPPPIVGASSYPQPLYDYVPGTVGAPPAIMAQPEYRYVYQPDRILVIDPMTGIAVQAIPR